MAYGFDGLPSNALPFSRPLREEGISRTLLVSKCQRSWRASAAQRVGWNGLFGGPSADVIGAVIRVSAHQ